MDLRMLQMVLMLAATPFSLVADTLCQYRPGDAKGAVAMDSGSSGSNLAMSGLKKAFVFEGGGVLTGKLNATPGDYEELTVSFQLFLSGKVMRRETIIDIGHQDGMKFYLYKSPDGAESLNCAAVYSDMERLPALKTNGPWMVAGVRIDSPSGLRLKDAWHSVTGRRNAAGKTLELLVDGKLVASKPCVYPLSLTGAPRTQPGWANVPLGITIGDCASRKEPFHGMLGQVIVTTPAPDKKRSTVDARQFLQTLKLGLMVFKDKRMPDLPLARLTEKLAMVESRLASTKTPSQEALGWLDSLEKIMVRSSAKYLELLPRSPNRWGYSRDELLKALDEHIADWRGNADSLSRFGLAASPDCEIERINLARLNAKTTAFDLLDIDFEQTYVFYKKVVEERFRLGAEILSAGRELDGLLKAAKLRRSLGGPDMDLAALSREIDGDIAAWRGAYNRGDFAQAAVAELKTRGALKRLKDQVNAPDSSVPVVRPGVSFVSSGPFAFGGSWQTLLSSLARGAEFYRDPKEEFAPYDTKKIEWAVSFGVSGANYEGYDIKDGSWTYAHRVNHFKDAASGKVLDQDCWWSLLAPGALLDTHAPAVTFSDLTRGAVAPDKVVGVFGGKPAVVRKGEPLSPVTMTEGWLLLLWEAPAAQVPILVFFERAPDKLEWDADGLCATRSPALGKYAVAPLYGAAPRPPAWSKEWKEIPAAALNQCRDVASRLAFFPLDVDEFFSVGKDRVQVWNILTKSLDINGTWSVPAPAYTTVPPLFALGLVGGAPVSFEQKLSPPLLDTKFGFFQCAEGTTLSYSVPLPDLSQRVPLKPSGEEALLDSFNQRLRAPAPNKIFNNVEYTRGMLFIALLGFSNGLCMATPESMDYLDFYKDPVALEGLLNGERCSGNVAPIHLQITDFYVDPLTGTHGWIRGWRGNRHDIPTRGDPTCFNMEGLAGAYAEAIMFGRWELVERHWDYLLKLYTSTTFKQHWAIPGQDCMTTGVCFAGDMLGDGFRTNSIMRGMAHVLGDRETEDMALYLAGKQVVSISTLVSPNLVNYNAHVNSKLTST